MNKNNNSYIIAYAAILVIVVAAALSFAALKLKSRQAENVRMERMSDILRSIGQGGDADKAADKIAYINEQYKKYITDSYAVNTEGDVVKGADAFNILLNLKAEYDKPEDQRELPIFVSRDDAGKPLYVIPVWGSGLWWAIWGYVALESDWDTIYGVVFAHKSETPGLGAEITTSWFQDNFKGKKIFNQDELVSISVMKGGADPYDPYSVDAVSGGTITSRSVENMLKRDLTGYAAYFRKMRAGQDNQAVSPDAENGPQPAVDSTIVNNAGHE